MRHYAPVNSVAALTVATAVSPISAMSMSDPATALAATGAEGLTLMLIVAGVIVVLGAALFVISRRNRSDDALEDTEHLPAEHLPAEQSETAVDAEPNDGDVEPNDGDAAPGPESQH